MALEDPAGFALGVPSPAGVGDDLLRSLVAAKLGDRHPVQHGVHSAVAAEVELVADRLALPLARRRLKRRRAVEAGERAFACEPAAPAGPRSPT